MSSEENSDNTFSDQGQPEDQVVIRARNLTKAYPKYDSPAHRLKQLLWPEHRDLSSEFLALRDVSLDIYKGETVGIIGRNGSGKSTLLNLIAGTLEPSAGELEVSGHLAPILTLGAGFDPEFTGRENVLMNAAVIGLSKAEIHARLGSISDFAGIGNFLDRPVKLYSSGMYARLAFAVAINSNPDILVIDEILSVGDEAFARKCFARLEDLKASGSTILFVSHSSQTVIELCDRAILFENGENLLTASPRDTVAYYHKLLYAEETNRDSLIEEIQKFDAARTTTQGKAAEASHEFDGDEKLGTLDPGLKPESTSEYEQIGAEIRNVRILNSRGEVVNILSRGGKYVYTYDVHFSEDAYGVRFGMMVKAGTGLEISGQVSHGAKDLIEHIPALHRARVSLPFKAGLSSGTYFVNAGVTAIRDGEMKYLHRILDAVAFRIEEVENDRVTGRIDLTLPGDRVEIFPPE